MQKSFTCRDPYHKKKELMLWFLIGLLIIISTTIFMGSFLFFAIHARIMLQ